MNETEIKDASIKSLLGAYAQAAAEHGTASRNADHETANLQYEIMAKIIREMRARGLDAQVRLLDLLYDSNLDVRIWASSHSLEFAPEQAESALEDLSHSKGMTGFEARMTLEEWRRGALRFP